MSKIIKIKANGKTIPIKYRKETTLPMDLYVRFDNTFDELIGRLQKKYPFKGPVKMDTSQTVGDWVTSHKLGPDDVKLKNNISKEEYDDLMKKELKKYSDDHKVIIVCNLATDDSVTNSVGLVIRYTDKIFMMSEEYMTVVSNRPEAVTIDLDYKQICVYSPLAELYQDQQDLLRASVDNLGKTFGKTKSTKKVKK